jgi:hypothetical protein
MDENTSYLEKWGVYKELKEYAKRRSYVKVVATNGWTFEGLLIGVEPVYHGRMGDVYLLGKDGLTIVIGKEIYSIEIPKENTVKK